MTHFDETMLKDFRWNSLPEKEQGYLVGIFLGDGNIFLSNSRRIYRVRFFFSSERDREILERMVNILKQIFVQHKIRIYRDKKGEIILEVHSKTLTQKLLEITEDKTLKSIDLPTEFLKGVLEGMIDSDGYVTWRRAQIVTANEKLRDQLSLILSKLDINFKIYKSISHWSGNIMWRLYFSFVNILSPLKSLNNSARLLGSSREVPHGHRQLVP